MLKLTIEEIKDVLIQLDQCECEGYFNSSYPAYTAKIKLENCLHYLESYKEED